MCSNYETQLQGIQIQEAETRDQVGVLGRVGGWGWRRGRRGEAPFPTHPLPEVHPRHTRGGPVRAASLLFPVSAHRSPAGPARPAPRGGLGPRAAGAGAPRGTRSRRGRRRDALPDVVGEGRILIAYRLLPVRNVCLR